MSGSRSIGGRVSAAAVAVAALMLVVSTAAPAEAGTLHVYSCTDPSTGAVLPTTGWTASGNGPTFDTCSSQPISGGLSGESWAQFGGTLATWTFSAPANTEIASAIVYRSAVASYRTLANWAVPENAFTASNVFDTCQGTDVSHSCVIGEPSATTCASTTGCYPAADALSVPLAQLPSPTLSLNVRCLEQGCGGAETMHSADITLAQSLGPSASAVSGSLVSESVLEGEPSIVVNASDPGTGVYRVEFIVDGTVIAQHALGQCDAYSVASDGAPVFLSPQPCPASVANVSVPFDTSQVSDGVHQLTVVVTDAAGNAATVLTRTVPFNNRGEYVVLLRRKQQAETEAAELATLGSCNATCDERAYMRAIEPKRTDALVRRTYGHSGSKLEGQLFGHNGVPIADATVELTQLASYRGSQAQRLGTTTTNRAGVWTFSAPPGPSRMLTVSYRARSKDASAAAVLVWRELVPAPVSLRAPRVVSPNESFSFQGRTGGGFIPAGGLLVSLEIYYAGRWREIALLRTGPQGRFHYRYVFAVVPPVRYFFRALVPRSTVYPFSPGASSATAVRLR